VVLITIVHANKTVLIPLIYAFKEKISRHILVYDIDKVDTRYALELERGIQRLWEYYKLPPVSIEKIPIDEDSRSDLAEMQTLFSTKNDEVYYLNAAEADVTLLTVFSGYLLATGGIVLAYDKHDNTYNRITKSGISNHVVERSMMIEDFLMLMNEEYLEETPKKKIRASRKVLGDLFGDAKRMFKIRRLLQQQRYSEIVKLYPNMVESLKTLHLLDRPGHMKNDISLSAMGVYFEQFVFLYMDQFDFDDIKCGIKIAFEREKGNDRDVVVSNEFDILTIKENRVGLVECKIGDKFKTVETVYKSDALMDYFGDDSRSLIVNIQQDATPHLSNSRLNFSNDITLRANSKRIDIFNAFDLGKRKFSAAVEETFGVKKRLFLLGGELERSKKLLTLLERCGQEYRFIESEKKPILSDFEHWLSDEVHFYATGLIVDMEVPYYFTEMATDEKSVERVLSGLLDCDG